MAESARERADCPVRPGQQFQSEILPKMSTLTLILKRFRLAPFLLCAGISLALNLWPALSQAQTVTLSVDPCFVHYSNPSSNVTVTAELSAPRTQQDTEITLSLGGTAMKDTHYTTDYTTDNPLPTITIDAGETSGSVTLSIGPPDVTDQDPETIAVRGRAPSVSVTPATITLVKDDEAQDRTVLKALYQATNGRGWTTNTNWGSSDDPLDTWHGVITNNAGRVTELDLKNNRLSGRLPPVCVLGSLPFLTLDLSHNNLSGNIPNELGDLDNLTELHLNNNRLSGNIPAELGDLDDLTELHLNNNRLSGNIPAELGDLDDLTALNLSHNNLSGPIPDELGSLSRLTELHLNNNRLSGFIPAELGVLDDLTALNLSHNNLSGPIPDELGDLDNLTELHLNNNRLSGNIPAELGDLDDLTALNLSHNNLSGPIPAELGSLSRLTELHLNNNRLSGPIPPELSNLDDRVVLTLDSDTGLCEQVPEVQALKNKLIVWGITLPLCGPREDEARLRALYRATNGTEWATSTNWNTSAALNTWDGVTTNNAGRVTELDLSNNNLSGNIPPELSDLTELHTLDLSNNNLGGRIPPELDKLSDLRVLRLDGNRLRGPLPDSLLTLDALTLDTDTGLCQAAAQAERLRRLGITLPPCGDGETGGDRAVLQALYRATNGTEWEDPDGVPRNQNWTTPATLNTWYGVTTNDVGRVTALHLDNNNLHGFIPPELGDLASLRILDLSDNNLSGLIPPELGDLPDLQVLRLDGNRLRGPLPDSLLTLDALTLDTDTGLCQMVAQVERLRRLGITLPLCGPQGAERDWAVLQALYQATNGTGWAANINWNTSAALNTWHGVTTNSAGRVTALHLDNNGLSGLIPAELSDLTDLTYLNLSNNTLSGRIPPELSDLTDLTYLNLSNNTLSGRIPPELGDLTSLQVLDLSSNDLSGRIPAELGDLPDLQALYLAGNRLRGALPDSLLNLGTLTLDGDDMDLCRTATQAEWLRRLGITLPPCGAGGTTLGTATPLLLTSAAPTTSVPSQLVAADDVHYFRLDIPRRGILIVETTGDTDTFGRLTQEGTRAVITDEDSGADHNFRIAQPVIGDTYFVEVSGGGEIGEYTLAVEYRPGMLENPQPGSFQSGIGVISGWVCEADQVVIEFERPGGTVWREPAAYGTRRTDTVGAGACAYPDSGFGLLWNWNKLGPGKHTVRAMVDGVILAEHTLIVTTLGLGEFPRGLHGDYELMDFPNMGDTTRLLWQEALQNFVIAPEPGGDETGGGHHQNPRQAQLAGQAQLENPQPGSFQSGIGVISGWVCEADEVIIQFKRPEDTDWSEPEPTGYGTSRPDTSGKCGDAANGFGLLWNWNKLGPGQHTIRALADGFEFARSTFTVTTLGEEFAKGLDAEYELEDFPEVGTTVTVQWQEALQNFTITGVE